MRYYCSIRKDGDGYVALFPDLPNVLTWGENREHVLEMAHEALNGVLETEISLEMSEKPPRTGPGPGLYPVEVEPRTALALELRRLRGNEPQKVIADKLGLSYQAYQRLENPRKGNPTVGTLNRLARAYGRRLEIRFVADIDS